MNSTDNLIARYLTAIGMALVMFGIIAGITYLMGGGVNSFTFSAVNFLLVRMAIRDAKEIWG